MPKRYEDLRVFKRARVLVRRVYRITSRFPRAELYGLVSQMRRAATSVLSNIAESQGRLTYGESRQLLSGARGSLFELEAQTISAGDLGFVEKNIVALLRTRIRATARPLTGFIRWTQDRENSAKHRHPSPVPRHPTDSTK
jgi:four helix bundle protein